MGAVLFLKPITACGQKSFFKFPKFESLRERVFHSFSYRPIVTTKTLQPRKKKGILRLKDDIRFGFNQTNECGIYFILFSDFQESGITLHWFTILSISSSFYFLKFFISLLFFVTKFSNLEIKKIER